MGEPLDLFRDLPKDVVLYILESYMDGKALSTLSVALMGSIRHSDIDVIPEVSRRRLQTVLGALNKCTWNVRAIQDVLMDLLNQHHEIVAQQQPADPRYLSLQLALIDYLQLSQSKSQPAFQFPLWHGEVSIRRASNSGERRLRLPRTQVSSPYFHPGLIGKWKRAMDQSPLFVEESRNFRSIPPIGKAQWMTGGGTMRAMVSDYFDDLDLTRSVLAPRIQTGELSIFFATRKVASHQFPSYLNPVLFDPYGVSAVPMTTSLGEQHEQMLHCFWSEDSDNDEADGNVVLGERDLSFVLDLITLMRKWTH
jgi:hypothetical protein